MTGHDPDDRGDDADGTNADAKRPDGWPDDWTTADDDTHAPSPDPDDDASVSDPAPSPDPASTSGPVDEESVHDHTPVDAPAAPDSNSGADASAEANASANDQHGGDPNESTLGTASNPEKPPAPNVDDTPPTIADDGLLTWFLNTPNGFVVLVRDIVSSVAAVAAIGLVLFAISGIWPPLVAVESGSMEPHMSKGDLVFIVDETRYAPQSAVHDTGVSTYDSAQAANGYWKVGNYGDVIVYRPYGDDRATPIIHRARFYVEEGDNWVQDANPDHLGAVDSCREVPRDMCPAPYDGFITKGDANQQYDQVGSQSTIVKSEWVRGKAQIRIPLLGWIRLQFAKLATTTPAVFSAFSALPLRLGALGFAGGAAVLSHRL